MFTESTYENAVIQLFEGMGYTHIYAPEMGREDFSDPLMDGVLRDALVRINRGLPLEAIGEALSKIRNFDGGSLIEKNRTFTEYLQNGVEVNYAADGETRSALVRLVDFEKVENNKFAVVNQYTYIENGNNRRPDIILFVNGSDGAEKSCQRGCGRRGCLQSTTQLYSGHPVYVHLQCYLCYQRSFCQPRRNYHIGT